MKTKKTLLIAPALGVLLLAAAGSVSGTVAWFSAVRVFDTDVGNFSVVETDGSLACVMAGGQGTTAAGDAKSVDVDDDVVLTHGSVNAVTTGDDFGKAFVIDPDDTSAYISKGLDSGTNWLYKGGVLLNQNPSGTATVDVYIAVSWTMTFTYTFASDATPVGIFLDLGKSKFNPVASPNPNFTSLAAPGDTSLLDTAKGFRIGFYGGVYKNTSTAADGARNVVWGNNTVIGDVAAYDSGKAEGYAVDAKVTHTDSDGITRVYKKITAATPAPAGDWVASGWQLTGEITSALNTHVATTSTPAAYGAKDYVVTNPIDAGNPGAYARISAGAEPTAWTSSQAAERLCVLTKAQPSVTVKCAAWYEGTDPNVVTGSAMKCLSAHINVYARTLGA